MPEEDGYSLMKRVRRRSVERGGAVPAIALTALAEHRDRIAALAAGYQIHLAKPVNLEQLLLAPAAPAPAPAGRGGRGAMVGEIVPKSIALDEPPADVGGASLDSRVQEDPPRVTAGAASGTRRKRPAAKSRPRF